MLISLASVSAIVSGPAVPVASAAPACPTPGSRTSPTSGLVKQAHPAVLVHGWDGSPMATTRTLLERQLPSGWQFLLFDYSAVHDHWAARPEIAACLASYIAEVSQMHRDSGGDGKVYLVAHSMGGLAVAYAANEQYGKVPSLSDHIGGLVTIDTPWTGSPWGGSDWARFVQGWANTDLPGPQTDAWTCLRQLAPGGSGGCSDPQFMDRGVPVAQVAGDLTVRRTFFGLHAYDISLGSDTIVSDDSQHGYLQSAPGSPLGLHTSSPQVSCTATMNAILAEGGARLGRSGGTVGSIIGGLTGTELQLLSDGKAMDAIGSGRASAALIEFLLRAAVVSPCAHTNMPTNPDALAAVAAALREQASPRPLIPTDLLSAPVPASCQHHPGKLVHGELPLAPTTPSPGFATVLQGEGSGRRPFLVQPVVSDLTGDGTPELSGVLLCSAGGVTWPELILVYSTGLKLLGHIDLSEVIPREHSDIRSITAQGRGLKVTWSSYDGCCFNPQDHTGTVHWDGQRIVMTLTG